MKEKQWMKRILSLTLVMAVLLSSAVPSFATSENKDNVLFTEVDNDMVSATLLEPPVDDAAVPSTIDYEPDEFVRVSIVLEQPSTIDKGYAVYGIADNADAMSYRRSVANTQETMIRSIERELGNDLDVKWRLTLAANIISAEVEYGQIDTLKEMDGVKEIVLETQYYPMVLEESENTASPHMVISTQMTGSTTAWTEGYTGAGSRIAIIDTGIDSDHQSFSEAGYLYALEKNAEKKGVSTDAYKESLNLLDSEEIGEKLRGLNVVGKASSASGSNLYKSAKIPFAFNYIDNGYDYITHDKDTQTDHGSHVAGIAAANRYIPKGNGYIDALEKLYVAGNAPDAQLLVMKVFGINGGAFDSDYMAAIEDAIMLGADTINLSLGTRYAGYSTAGIYQDVMNSLIKHGAVVAMAAGNSDGWPDYSNTASFLDEGYLYADDVYYDTLGSPASYTNSLAVASVDSKGQVMSGFLEFSSNGKTLNVGYSENLSGNMKAMESLDIAESGGTEFEFVIVPGLGSASDFEKMKSEGIEVEGKIAVIRRGELAFYEKATNAVNAGAIGTVIYNNVDGTIGMDLTDYKKEAPAVVITKQDADSIMNEFAEKHFMADGKTEYYTGKLRVRGDVVKAEDSTGHYSMSDFSSWGTTGDLALKPEISAPGGSVYSVKGDVADTNRYKTNSGTSMASPQVAGIGAVVAQYIKNNNILQSITHTSRQLNQSLLMASAIPMKDENGNYYPVLRQGSGLANAEAAINADAYIIMDPNATQSWADGKVKAELGDDPQRAGTYEFSFNIYNLNKEKEKSYTLSADLFTQDILDEISAPDSNYYAYYMLKSTKTLDSDAQFKDAAGNILTNNEIVVPAGGSAKVTVCLTVTNAGKRWIDEYYKNGTYIQGFVFAEPRGDAEGVKTSSTLSIPVLGFYGNWTDASMYDSPSYKDGEIVSTYSTQNTTDRSRIPYLNYRDAQYYGIEPILYGQNHIMIDTDNTPYAYPFGGNPLIKDEEYHPERNAVSGTVTIDRWKYIPMRASVTVFSEITNVRTGEVYASYRNDASEEKGIWYNKASQAWSGGQVTVNMRRQLPDVPEGDTIRFSLVRLPEYYSEGKTGENSSYGKGAVLSIDAIVDETNPKVEGMEHDSQGFTITASDENYIAGVVLYSGTGDEVIAYTGAKDDIRKGESAEYEINCGHLKDNKYLLQVYDYAMNAATYYIEVDDTEISFEGSILAFDLDRKGWVQVDKAANEIPVVGGEVRKYTAASAVMEKIYAIAYGTELYCLNVEDPETSAFIGNTGLTIVDLCYSAADDCLYGVTDLHKLARINMNTGKGIVVGTIPFETNTIACDETGVFYSNLYGTGKVYSYTIDAIKAGDITYDFDGTGAVNEGDVQALLDYVNGKRTSIEHLANADMDGDNDVDSYDAYLLLDKLPGRMNLVVDTRISSRYMQAMEIDPNDGTLYWTSYCVDKVNGREIGFTYLYEIDVDTGKFTHTSDLGDQLCSLVILDKNYGNVYGPTTGTEFIELSEAATTEYGSAVSILSTEETAGIAAENGVDNSIKNEESDETKTVEVELKAGSDTANGLYAVTYSPEELSVVSWKSNAEFTSIDHENGQISFSYVGKNEFKTGEIIALFTFETMSCETDAEMTLKQENNSRPNTKMTVDVGAHTWGEWKESKAATCIDEGEEIRICSECQEIGKRNIPANEKLHVWSEWETVLNVSGNDCGVEERTCSCCFITAARWIIPENLTMTVQDAPVGRIDMYKDGVDYGEVFDVGIEKVSTINTPDGSMHYLVELSAVTEADASFDVILTPTYKPGSGVGVAIKREKVASVEWDEDDTDYVVKLDKGIGELTAYSYYNKTQYTPIKIYFVVGETGVSTGQRSYVALPEITEGTFIGYLRGIDFREVGVSKVYNTRNDEGTEIESVIWLDEKTADDAEVIFNLVTSGTIYELKDTETHQGISSAGHVIKLEQGKATLRYTVKDYNGNRTYVIHLRNYINSAPELIGTAAESRRVKIHTPFCLDLSTVFSDANGDELTYTVSVNGGETAITEEQFSITPDTAGDMVLSFQASDGLLSCEESYTLTLNVSEKAYTTGDTNGDGTINNKDVTVLKRYIAHWSGIMIELEAADTNGDGTINNKDVTILKRYIAHWPGVTLGQ